MERRKRYLLAACLLVSATLASYARAQDSNSNDFQSKVIAAVAQSLGADQRALPPYIEQLKAARYEADKTAICGSGSTASLLNEPTIDIVLSHAVALLSNESVLFERPRYIKDILVVGIVSFEAGRLAGSSNEYRAALCAPSSEPISSTTSNLPADTAAQQQSMPTTPQDAPSIPPESVSPPDAPTPVP